MVFMFYAYKSSRGDTYNLSKVEEEEEKRRSKDGLATVSSVDVRQQQLQVPMPEVDLANDEADQVQEEQIQVEMHIDQQQLFTTASEEEEITIEADDSVV